MHKGVSKRDCPFDHMDDSSKKRKKRGKRGSKRGKRKIDGKNDYISDLPEHLLHQILARLHRKDAARTCILSRKWKQIWNSYQVLDFDLSYVRDVSNSVKENYKNQIYRLQSIQKLRLCFANTSGLTSGDAYDWIAAAIERKVRELEVQAKGFDYYFLPPCVMRGSSITALNLYGCYVPTYSINLPQLQKLSLKSMDITALVFQDLISGCPHIQDLRLIHCTGLKKLNICNLNRLKRVDLHKCLLLDNIFIKAQSLETFWYYNSSKKLCKINIEACRGLKELIMEYPRMTDEFFHGQILEFPELEKLVLSRCNGLKNISLIGRVKLRKLVIRRCWNLKQAQFDTPNLASLEYSGRRMPLSFLTRLSLNNALLSFESSSTVTDKWKGGGEDASRLSCFLQKIDCKKGLKFMSLNERDIVIYEDIRAMFLPLRYISNPWAVRMSVHFQDLLDAALKKSPLPSTLSIMSHGSSDFPEVFCSIVIYMYINVNLW
ncbi:hypothetical protein RDABS01_020794 [Bienertia sinuspersici]